MKKRKASLICCTTHRFFPDQHRDLSGTSSIRWHHMHHQNLIDLVESTNNSIQKLLLPNKGCNSTRKKFNKKRKKRKNSFIQRRNQVADWTRARIQPPPPLPLLQIDRRTSFASFDAFSLPQPFRCLILDNLNSRVESSKTEIVCVCILCVKSRIYIYTHRQLSLERNQRRGNSKLYKERQYFYVFCGFTTFGPFCFEDSFSTLKLYQIIQDTVLQKKKKKLYKTPEF